MVIGTDPKVGLPGKLSCRRKAGAGSQRGEATEKCEAPQPGPAYPGRIGNEMSEMTGGTLF